MGLTSPQTLIPQPIDGDNLIDDPIIRPIDPIDPFPRISWIKGAVWNDTDGDGRRDFNEKPLSGWTVYLDNNRNGRYDSGERTAITTSTGEYSFAFGLIFREDKLSEDLTTPIIDPYPYPYDFGTHTVALKPQSGWKQTSFPTSHKIFVESGQTYSNRNFGVQKNVILPKISSIKGAVWNDADGDGRLDLNEQPLSGWTVYLDSNGNGRYDSGERTTTTNSAGEYSFAFSLLTNFGTHTVALKPQSGWKQTSFPTTHTVTVEPGQTYANRNFGVQKPIINLNRPPVARDDRFTFDKGIPLAYSGNVLLNDSDPNNDPLTVIRRTSPRYGDVLFADKGQFYYVPDADFPGTDSFTYTVSDGKGGTDTATVYITINEPNLNFDPFAKDDYFTINEDTILTENVLRNDIDLDGDDLTAEKLTNPSNGKVELNPDGSFTYTPNANYHGKDSFTYQASDGKGGTDKATVTLTVKPINDNPVAVDDYFTINEDTTLTGNVLRNDIDPDGDVITLSQWLINPNPKNGKVYLNPDGSFTYIPNANFNGKDSFTYTVSDGKGGTDKATVYLTINPINDNPVANNDSFTLDEDTTLRINVLSNDTDVDGDRLTVKDFTNPKNGTIARNRDFEGSLTYIPNANFNGTDSFTYEASDGQGGTDKATVYLTINPINDNPVANNDSFTLNEDTTFKGNVLINDTDVDGDNLTAKKLTNPSNGKVEFNPDGSFTYTPDANFNGTDSFTYQASDGEKTDTATVTLTVNPINDNPVANNDSFTLDEDTTLTGNVLTNDTDVDGDDLTAKPLTNPSNGKVEFNPDGSFTYIPNTNFNGTDSFTYEVSDGKGGTDKATVTLTVNPVNGPRLVGKWDFLSYAHAVTVIGDYAYVVGDVLEIVDISNPSQPIFVENYDLDHAKDVEIVGNLAYVADESRGLQIIDISDPTNPTLTGKYDTSGRAEDVEIVGNYAYVVDWKSGLKIIDISDPTNPTFTGKYDTSGRAEDVEIVGKLAYVADGYGGLQIIDISDSSNPTLAGNYNTSGQAWDLEIVGNYAYVADKSSGLKIIDISDPSNPTLTKNYHRISYADDVEIVGNFAYVAEGARGLQIIDISDPSNPILTGNYNTSGQAWDVEIVGNFAYLADRYSGLQIIDISDPNNPTLTSNYDTSDYAVDVEIVGNFAYVADGRSGLKIIDISDPNNPTLTSNYDTSGFAQDVEIVGNFAYVADHDGGLQIIDISDSSNPTLAGNYNISGYAQDLEIVGNFAYVADRSSGLKIIDISDPSSPTLTGNYNTSGSAWNVEIVGNFAYVADLWSGLQIIDISDSSNLTLTGNYNTSGSAYGVEIVGNFAYVADSNGGLQIIDISDSSNPTLTGNYNTSGSAYDVEIVGNLAYIADGSSGLQIINISDPSNPTLADNYDTSGNAKDVEIVGNLAYVADNEGGLKIIDISDFISPNQAPTAIALSDNTIAENEAIKTIIGNFSTTDPDINETFTYDLVSGNGDTDNSLFTLEGNVLKTNSIFDYEGKNTYSIRVQTTDTANNTYSEVFTINVSDVNEAPILVNPIPDQTITQNEAFSLTIPANTFEDVDTGDNLNYSMSGLPNGLSFDAATRTISGTVTQVGDFDVVVTVTDIAGATVSDTFTLTVDEDSVGDGPRLVGEWDSLSYTRAVTVIGDYAYVVGDFLDIVDISNPSDPKFVGNYDLHGANDVEIAGNFAYVADDYSGLKIIDISDPTNPTLTSENAIDDANDVEIAGNFAYVADGFYGLQMIDISDPSNPTLTSTYDILGYANDVEIVGNYAYVVDLEGGLRIIDVSDPSHPTFMGYDRTIGYANDVEVVGNYAYVADGNVGLEIIDISTPRLPSSIGNSYHLGYAVDVEVVGNYAYVVDWQTGLKILDISDPKNPTLTSNYDTSGSAQDVEIVGNLAYVADGDGGLKILDISEFVSTSEVEPSSNEIERTMVTGDNLNLGEVDTITLDHNLQTITLDQTYNNPVIFAPSVSFNGHQLATPRITNVTNNSFDIYLQEPSNEDGSHTSETLSYLVFEAGTYQLSDGTLVEVGTLSTDATANLSDTTLTPWQTVEFDIDFADTPVIFSQVQTDNERDLVRTRQQNATANGFEVVMEEDEIKARNGEGHLNETIGYLAIASGSGNSNGVTFQAGSTSDSMTHALSSIDFGGEFSNIPHFFASIATYDGPDPSALRYQNLTTNGVKVKVQEDTTFDNEINHTTEGVNYLAIEGDNGLQGTAYDPLTGNRAIMGTEGDDYLLGLAENDTRIGSSGSDIFVLESDRGTDTITDFELGVDQIGLSGGLTFGSLTLTDNGNDTIITANSQPLAILKGIQSTGLTSNDFLEVTI